MFILILNIVAVFLGGLIIYRLLQTRIFFKKVNDEILSKGDLEAQPVVDLVQNVIYLGILGWIITLIYTMTSLIEYVL